MSYRFHLDRRALARVVRRAARLIGTGRRSLDHDGVWIDVEDGWLTMASTRPPVTLQDRIRIDGAGRGSLVVPIGPLRGVVLSRRSGEAELEGDDESITLRSGSYIAELRAIAPGTVTEPAASLTPNEHATVGGVAFRDGLDHTALSLGHHRAWRPSIAGLEMTITPGSVRLAATDLETLAIAEFRDPLATAGLEGPLIAPGEGLVALGRYLPARRRVAIHRHDNQMEFIAGETEIRIDGLRGSLPDYEPLRRTPTTRTVRVDAVDLRRSLRRVSLLSSQSSPARVWMEFMPDTIAVRGFDRQVGEAADLCRAELNGDPCVVGVYLWTLMACLHQLKTADVVIEIGDPKKRMSLHCVGSPQRRYHMLPLATEAL